MATPSRFEIHIDPIQRAPMLLIGGDRGQCWVDVGESEIDLKLGRSTSHVVQINLKQKQAFPMLLGI